MVTLEKIIINEEFLNLLKTYNVFQDRSGMRAGEQYIYHQRFKIGEEIYFSRESKIEEFTTFAHGNMLFSAGAFSSLVSTLPCGSKVGRYCSLASGIKLMGFRHPIEASCMNSAVFNFQRENISSYFSLYEQKYGKLNKVEVPTPQPQKKPIMIGNDVWIGNNVVLCGGITIGDGAVIAGNSVVTKDVAPYSITAGVPALHRKFRFPEEIIKELLAIQWWNYELGDLYREEVPFSHIEKFLTKLEQVKNNIRPLNVRKIYPYLYNFRVSSLENSKNIYDFHGNIILYDQFNKKLVKCKNYDNDFLSLTVKEVGDSFYLYVDDLGFLVFLNNKIFFSKNYYDSNCVVSFLSDNRFSIGLRDLYLSSNIENDFSWKEHCKAWENFYWFA